MHAFVSFDVEHTLLSPAACRSKMEERKQRRKREAAATKGRRRKRGGATASMFDTLITLDGWSRWLL
jgi:hypothetical protein